LKKTAVRDVDGDPVLKMDIDNPAYLKARAQLEQRDQNGKYSLHGDLQKEILGDEDAQITHIEEMVGRGIIAHYVDSEGNKRGVHIPSKIEVDVSIRNNNDITNKGWAVQTHNDKGNIGIFFGGLDRSVGLSFASGGDDAETLWENDATTTVRTNLNGTFQGYEQKVNTNWSFGPAIVLGQGLGGESIYGDKLTASAGANLTYIYRLRTGINVNAPDGEFELYTGNGSGSIEAGVGVSASNLQSVSALQNVPVIGPYIKKLDEQGHNIGSGAFYEIASAATSVKGSIAVDLENKKAPASLGPKASTSADISIGDPLFWLGTTQDIDANRFIPQPDETISEYISRIKNPGN
jgi:hypothetical protein